VLGAAGKLLYADPPPQGKPLPWKSISDRKIRVGVVGGGFGLGFPWHQHPNCIVEAVSDLQTDRRNALMRYFACKKSYESLEKLVLDDKIDAVAVFTDAPSHGRHVVLTMQHGKHCFSAVPACMNLDDAHELKEIKEQTRLKYMMAESSYYHGDVIQSRNIYRQGVKLVYSEGQYYHDGVFHTSEGSMFRCNVFWKCRADGDYGLAIWATDPHADKFPSTVSIPPGMDPGGHGGSAGPLANEFLMAILENREPAVDIYEALAMTAPGIVAHQSALKNGEMLDVPSFEKKRRSHN
jgi:hypothetical protein